MEDSDADTKWTVEWIIIDPEGFTGKVLIYFCFLMPTVWLDDFQSFRESDQSFQTGWRRKEEVKQALPV